MVKLFGQTLTRRQVAERCGALSQFAGVRLMTLGDGVERDVRMLEFRTGSGLRFTVLIDRAFDIADCEFKGQAVGWHSASGFRHPGLHEYEGEQGLAWARSCSGFLLTCGLDHILGPEETPADSYHYPGKKTVRHALHGRVSTIPARLVGYGERWEGDCCTLWAEGEVRQAAVFGEDLLLIRRIEADVGGDEIRLSDRVINNGFNRTPHMLFYHVNIGHPILDQGARYLAPITDVVWAAHAGSSYEEQGIGYRTAPAPQVNFREQVWQHETAADAFGSVPVAIVNDRIGLGIEVETKKAQLPCLYQWQHFQPGAYVMGIEPSSHHVLGDNAARERGEMIWLEHGDARDYDVVFRVLDGREKIAATESRVRAIARPPEEDYPKPSGRFIRLSGR